MVHTRAPVTLHMLVPTSDIMKPGSLVLPRGVWKPDYEPGETEFVRMLACAWVF